MPIVVALVGLAMGQMAVLVVARFFDVATFAPTLAAMIGLGVGIDYALFVMNRFRQAVLAGHHPKAAAMESVATAGRAVLFAGATVIIALLGLFVLRINFFNGLALAAAVTVLMIMLSALWMLPALLSLLGSKALGLRLPWGPRVNRPQRRPEGRAWAHYGRALQARPWIPIVGATALVGLLAIPMFSLRQGFSDDSGKPAGSAARVAYDLRTEGFGAGVNGPFLVAVELAKPGDVQAYGQIVSGLARTEGVASTQPSVEMLPLVAANPEDFGLSGRIAVIGVVPTSAPQDEATTALLERLRGQTNPALEQATGARILVGGTQAITSDFTTVLTDALPLFLAVVIGLGFLALVLLFRSLVVPLTAAITSLMSFAAALGITVAVFQWGWFSEALSVSGTGPIFPFLPIMVFAILFGLSMDYQVFLVSRMQEEWARTGDNLQSVRRGLAEQIKKAEQDGDGEQLARLQSAAHEVRARFVPGLVVSDATTGALGVYMTEQGGAVAIFGTEATSFQTVAGQYSDKNGGNFGLLNHAYDAEQYSDRRIRRDGIRLDRPALSWCAAVQPEVMGGYATGHAEGSGFLNRFALFVAVSKIGSRQYRTDSVPPHVAAAWSAAVTGLHRRGWQLYGVMVDELPDRLGRPARVTFRDDAADMLAEYAVAVESELRGRLAEVSGWASKAATRVARIAAILALAEDPGRHVVEPSHVVAALSLAEPMTAHAVAGFAVMRQAVNVEPVERMREALQRHGEPVVSTRDAHRLVHNQGWTKSGGTRATREVLTALADDHGYVRLLVEPQPARGRPQERWEVHPNLIR